MTQSWIIRHKETGEVLAETFLKDVADAVNAANKGYEAIEAGKHLADLNRKIKANDSGAQKNNH